MGGDDLFGQIPRKKKDPPGSTSASATLPAGSGSMGNSILPSVPRKRSTTSTTSGNDNINVPRKSKPDIGKRQNVTPGTSASSFGGGNRSASTHRLDQEHYHRPPQGVTKPPPELRRQTSLASQQRQVKHEPHSRRLDPPQESNSSDGGGFNHDIPLYSNARFRIISENPLVLKIKIHDIPMTSSHPRSFRSIRQAAAASSDGKRQRSVYKELEDTDSDDYMTPEEEKDLANRNKKHKKNSHSLNKTGRTSEILEDFVASGDTIARKVHADCSSLVPGAPAVVDSTLPPGTISSLWYSREEFLDVFVLDKVCGWKTRQKVSLYLEQVVNDAPVESVANLDAVDAYALQQRILSNPDFYCDVKCRMEISRINPANCPIVMTLAAAQSQSQYSHDKKIAELAVSKNVYKLKIETDKEDVLLVKWRGRSYIHCSWERASDVQRLDPSTNFTARSKIRRFYQAQEIAYGPEWKTFLEDERKTAANLISADKTDTVENEPLDEYFSPQFLEIERVLNCDEDTMNMEVLSKQRAINLRKEQESVMRKEVTQTLLDKTKPLASTSLMFNPYQAMIQVILDSPDHPWDPEDNVRYVVKWKGLQYGEMTWEYWKDIKRDAVDEAEDYWYRQQAPDWEEASRLASKPHPQVRDFKKLSESPAYGVSKRVRLVTNEKSITEMSSHVEEETDNDPGFRLRAYQLEGVNWLLFNWWNKRSCILADEMGLGKTIQSAAFLQELQSQPAAEIRGPFLIVAPLSLVGQWQSELASWAPDMNVILYHGSSDAREYLVKEEFYYKDPFVAKTLVSKYKKLHITKFHVLITTFEVALKDMTVLSKIRWRALLVDEAHRLKNSNSKLFEELASVPRDYCVLLTGTPIANATEELWALLHFANPHMFADKDDFLMKFGEMTDAQQVNDLHSLLKPYLLRRVKEDVEKSLPPKEETILEVSLTPIQKTFYKAIYERNTAFLFKGAKPNNAPSLMNVMMELRKCCNHPFLVKGAEDRILSDAETKQKIRAEDDGTPFVTDRYKLFCEQLVKSSGKMVLMEKLLGKLFVDGHKVLIFSQMVRVLDLLEELLKFKKYRYERLDGSTSSSSRVHAVERFKKASLQRFVMLLSTRAGGLGLNLTAASVVIIFDSDWNPQNDLQAMARAHRIGQTKAVRVYRFLTAKTYEMHMFHSASLKLGLERAVLSQNREQGDDADENKSKRKNEREAQAREIDELLKKGAYDVFRDDDDREGEKFMETDIDQLLEQSSKKITYGASATTSIGSGLGSFSKASFVANTEDGAKDVDLDDPDFWSKAVGLEAPEETPDDVAAMLDDGVKRSRKQVQVYDPYAETAEAELRKKEKVAIEKQLEKEEKERLVIEKKRKKDASKKKRNRDESDTNGHSETENEHEKGFVGGTKHQHQIKLRMQKESPLDDQKTFDNRPKKQTKKFDRIKALKRAENEDPPVERIKQAWEAPHRNRATAATIRFGFGRFCKIRYESNLSGLPLQDIEVFVSAFVYQLALQLSVTLLSSLHQGENLDTLRPLLQEWIGSKSEREIEWICDSVQSAIQFQIEVSCFRRFLRMPPILAESIYLADLRRGAAFRALRRIGILNRLNCVIEEGLDLIIAELGHEELGKRGCGVNELSSLDADLKARYVATEEIALTVSSNFRKLHLKPPASWWDRSCDIGLIIGSFVHGLGNYEAMRNDLSLPFAEKIRNASYENLACKLAMQYFRTAASAARQSFDDALESARLKAELEVQAAVAAAAKAASKREEDAALLRKGGAEAEVAAKNMPETQVDNAFAFDGTDSHFVTLSRMHEYIQGALQKEMPSGQMLMEAMQESKIEDDSESQDDGAASSGRMKDHHILPMPDARILDHRMIRVLESIETVLYGESNHVQFQHPDRWEKSTDVKTNLAIRTKFAESFVTDFRDVLAEYTGVGVTGSQCGTSHRSLNDGSDYSFGSASNQLSQVAYGTDAPRFLRAIGVPMNVTRLAITGLAFVDRSNVDELLKLEKLRFRERVEQSTTSTESSRPTKLMSEGESNELSIVKSSATDAVHSPDPKELVPEVFQTNAELRASVCMVVLFYGYPGSIEGMKTSVDSDLWKSLLHESISLHETIPPPIFDMLSFRNLLISFVSDMVVPDVENLKNYIESILLPHCLRLCVQGNGPSTRSARGSHGAYETAFGISVHPDPISPYPTPLPDPCCNLQEHSLEAVGIACAILRRVRLQRTCQYVCCGKVMSVDALIKLTRSTIMGQLSDMPVWWCPWIHDIALLIQASSGGLFSVIKARDIHYVFSVNAIQKHLYSSFVAQENNLSEAQHTPPEKISAWAERQANKFPSLSQLERRLAILCSEATVDADDYLRYYNLPMFDHGGWPRN